jgi:hypothetical protein
MNIDYKEILRFAILSHNLQCHDFKITCLKIDNRYIEKCVACGKIFNTWKSNVIDIRDKKYAKKATA